MREAYRQELASTFAPARDDGQFSAAWASLVAYRALAILTWIPLSTLREDQSRVGRWTARQSLIATAERLHAATRGVPALAPLAGLGAALARVLRRRWPELGRGVRVTPVWGYERCAAGG
jgi:hypothetical protein